MLTHNLSIGQKVRVLQSNGESWKEIHSGVILELTSHFARVFKLRRRPDDDGDVAPDTAELFAINGPKIKII